MASPCGYRRTGLVSVKCVLTVLMLSVSVRMIPYAFIRVVGLFRRSLKAWITCWRRSTTSLTWRRI